MIRVLLVLILWVTPAVAEISVDPDRSSVRDGWWRLNVELGLSDIAPYRLFTLDQPRRLVIDFEQVVWDGVTEAQLLEPGRATGLRFGPLHDGWSRLVIDLADPLAVTEAGMRRTDAGVSLSITLKRASVSDFAASAGAPDQVPGQSTAQQQSQTDDTVVVVIDPGHGGIDPGADRGGVQEAPLMLQLGSDVAAALEAMPGVTPVLTRDRDHFVPLNRRVSLARAAGADLFISLHADALEEDAAEGASVYTLSGDGGDTASRRMVERHERGDLLSGVDLTGQGDRVASVLMDIARQDTGPAGRRFADLLVQQMRDRGVRLNARPRRNGQFIVLSAADFPSVLIEAGFLSNPGDRARLTDPATRAVFAQAIADAVQLWAAEQR